MYLETESPRSLTPRVTSQLHSYTWCPRVINKIGVPHQFTLPLQSRQHRRVSCLTHGESHRITACASSPLFVTQTERGLSFLLMHQRALDSGKARRHWLIRRLRWCPCRRRHYCRSYPRTRRQGTEWGVSSWFYSTGLVEEEGVHHFVFVVSPTSKLVSIPEHLSLDHSRVLTRAVQSARRISTSILAC